ncbi:MAG TPA: oligosaccharyl transferase, archaeosortase A system-associated [Methanocella sp.]|nr:oligosaccharyl transferase, archaeosortase A system-associated [Methanocella sp.]
MTQQKIPGPVREVAVQVKAGAGPKVPDLSAYFKSYAWVYPVMLILLMSLMFYFRAVPSHDNVFTSWGGFVNFADDDAPEQMRLVHLTVEHFPQRIFYDPFTHYPYGSQIHFGPLFTLMIATASLVLGLGHPSPALVDAVGAYTPAVMGMLCAIPTYFIGKKLYGRNTGIIAAATLALLPGPFMERSMLGFTDHHIAETLFSITALMLLIYALDLAKKGGLSMTKVRNKDRDALIALMLGALSGFSFGLYMLTWPAGLIVGGIIFLYFAIQASIDHKKGNDMEYMIILGVLTFGISGLMVLPYSLTNPVLQAQYYSLVQPLFLFGAVAGIGLIYSISTTLNRMKTEWWTYPVMLIGTAIAVMLVLYVAVPQVFSLIEMGLQIFMPSGGMTSVSEAMPPDWKHIWVYYFWTFPIAIVALVMLAYRTLKGNRPAEWLFLVWNLVMLLTMLSQDRFSYYFAVNVALLTAYFFYEGFRMFGWEQFYQKWRAAEGRSGVNVQLVGMNRGRVLAFAIMAIMSLAVITYPATSFSTNASRSFDITKEPVQYLFTGFTELISQDNIGVKYEWYETLVWMRDHTPDPQGGTGPSSLSYDSGTYHKPASGEKYPYPDNAYGVMSWWDYGHIIEYIAHRIPNANPFQAGINENNKTEGSAPFFLSTSEEEGYENLQDMGSKYVVIDYQMVTSKFAAITAWVNDQDSWVTRKNVTISGTNYKVGLWVDSPKLEQCLMYRLYFDDCDNMSHLRLVYESPGNVYMSPMLVNIQSGTIDYSRNLYPWSADNASKFNALYETYVKTGKQALPTNESSPVYMYNIMPPEKWVKVYQVVDGADITGNAFPGTTVMATMNLSAGDREFQYTKTCVADQNGTFTLTVPYATEAMNGAGYSSAVSPVGKYTLTAGNTTTQVNVPESAVQNGETIQVS